MIELVVTQTRRRFDGDPATPLLWYLRDELWVEHAVPQCGYCQSGQIMQAAALLQAKPRAAIKQVASGRKAAPAAAAKQDR
jgi:aerobic-type carbon monoxide dehydrogenase small subunit (CoxS/CutS family)